MLDNNWFVRHLSHKSLRSLQSTKSAIPVANLYYLLCYAWDVLPPRGPAEALAEVLPADHQPALSLLAHLLTSNLRRRQRRGLDVAYVLVEATSGHLRGRVLLDRLARNPTAAATNQLPTRCEELTAATPFNRLLVAALRHLLTTDDLPTALRTAARAALAPLNDVPPLPTPTPDDFRTTARALRPTDSSGLLLLRAAELLLLNLLPATAGEPGARRTRFHDFTADEVQMGRLFEAFVRNFLRREQRDYAVSADVLRWRGAVATTAAALPLLPVMRTDVTLTDPLRRLVIETKFYREPLGGSRFAEQKLLAPHLYQLLAYLRNHSADAGQTIEGLLLYPASSASGVLHLDYQLEGYRVRVRTLNLDQPWSRIHQELLGIVAD